VQCRYDVETNGASTTLAQPNSTAQKSLTIGIEVNCTTRVWLGSKKKKKKEPTKTTANRHTACQVFR
jgi:hypothetical protein